jgi:hypothetical protein
MFIVKRDSYAWPLWPSFLSHGSCDILYVLKVLLYIGAETFWSLLRVAVLSRQDDCRARPVPRAMLLHSQPFRYDLIVFCQGSVLLYMQQIEKCKHCLNATAAVFGSFGCCPAPLRQWALMNISVTSPIGDKSEGFIENVYKKHIRNM